jgi:hypothetical protein
LQPYVLQKVSAMNLPVRLSTGTLAALMIGDGLMAVFQPRRRITIWGGWRHPVTSVGVPQRKSPTIAFFGLIELGVGVWLATRRPPPRLAVKPAYPLSPRVMTRRPISR